MIASSSLVIRSRLRTSQLWLVLLFCRELDASTGAEGIAATHCATSPRRGVGMAQPLRGLAPQIPNASLVWNLKNGRFTRLIDTKQVVTVGSDPLSLLTQSSRFRFAHVPLAQRGPLFCKGRQAWDLLWERTGNWCAPKASLDATGRVMPVAHERSESGTGRRAASDGRD